MVHALTKCQCVLIDMTAMWCKIWCIYGSAMIFGNSCLLCSWSWYLTQSPTDQFRHVVTFLKVGGGHSSKNKEPPHPPNFFVLLNPENSNLWEGGGDVHIPTRTLISLLISWFSLQIFTCSQKSGGGGNFSILCYMPAITTNKSSSCTKKNLSSSCLFAIS